MMTDLSIESLQSSKELQSPSKAICQVKNGTLTIGKTTVPLYCPENKTKIPETLFYDTEQNLSTLEAMLQDYTLGEHLLLIGNQVSFNNLFQSRK